MLDRTSAPATGSRRRASAGLRDESADAARPADAGVETPHNVRRAGLVMIVALALMAVFNSAELRSLARDLPGHASGERMVALADGWHELMRALGPAHLRPAARAVFERLRSLSW